MSKAIKYPIANNQTSMQIGSKEHKALTLKTTKEEKPYWVLVNGKPIERIPSRLPLLLGSKISTPFL
jgi:hypothetical protein